MKRPDDRRGGLRRKAGAKLIASCRWILFWLGAAVMPALAEEVVLVDFSDPDGTGWQIVNDTVMGGRSSSRFQVADGALRFAGTLNTNGGGFASVRSGPLAAAATDQDLVRLSARGDGRRYQLRLYSSATGTAYRAEFAPRSDDWQTVELPLAAFRATWRGRPLDRPPISPSDIGGLGVMLADGEDGPFAIAVRRVVLVKASGS
jgi:monofunctional biosynthetic peptidoglycan transglycosylase